MTEGRPGFKTSALLKAGIKISPVAIGQPGSVAKFFKMVVTKTSEKTGKEIAVRGKDETYPEKDTKDKPGLYSMIKTAENFYYEKLMKNANV